MTKPKTYWIPETPRGTMMYELRSKTEDEAWAKLLKDAAHMPYKTKANFIKRGYTVSEFTEQKP